MCSQKYNIILRKEKEKCLKGTNLKDIFQEKQLLNHQIVIVNVILFSRIKTQNTYKTWWKIITREQMFRQIVLISRFRRKVFIFIQLKLTVFLVISGTSNQFSSNFQISCEAYQDFCRKSNNIATYSYGVKSGFILRTPREKSCVGPGAPSTSTARPNRFDRKLCLVGPEGHGILWAVKTWGKG